MIRFRFGFQGMLEKTMVKLITYFDLAHSLEWRVRLRKRGKRIYACLVSVQDTSPVRRLQEGPFKTRSINLQ